MPDPPHFLLASDLSRRWGVPPWMIHRWRRAGLGPAWQRIGARVFYRLPAVEAWEAGPMRGISVRARGRVRQALQERHGSF